MPNDMHFGLATYILPYYLEKLWFTQNSPMDHKYLINYEN